MLSLIAILSLGGMTTPTPEFQSRERVLCTFGEPCDERTLTLYPEAGFQGRETILPGSSNATVVSRRYLSLKTTGGAWEFCDQPNFQGQCRVADGWVHSLSRLGLRNIRSYRPIQADASSAS